MVDRRDFLGSLATTGLAASLPLDLMEPALPAAPTDAERRAAMRPLGDEAWDMSWVDRLRGKSRAVFDSPQPSEGGALFRAIVWRDQYAKVFGGAKTDVTPVVVLRHEAIPLIMDDAHWDRFGVGKALEMKDQRGKWYKRNPFSSAAADVADHMNEFTLPAFVGNGGIVLACNLAFAKVVARYQKEDELSEADATAAAKAHIIPGVILQPSGFFAVLKAQDEGCKYMLGS